MSGLKGEVECKGSDEKKRNVNKKEEERKEGGSILIMSKRASDLERPADLQNDRIRR
jgi:hypothetical protein